MAYISFQPNDYFNTKLYTGNGSTNAITGVGFQPDWVWVKNRTDASTNHLVTDAVRGATKCLFPNLTNAEVTEANALQSFNSDGFTLGSDSSVNTNTKNWVSWNWRANGSGSSNTDGSITSTVSANTTSGFSIVTYTGTGANATIGHGLGVAPKMIIFKNRSSVKAWSVYHSSIGATKFLFLNDTGAETTYTPMFNDTEPTSSVFSVGTDLATNVSSDNYVAYCFAEKKGFSKFGSYTGNSSTDGTFVFCGFKPAFLIQKRSDTTSNWNLYDNKRSTAGGSNVIDDLFYVDANNAEVSHTSVDFLSNGFKFRSSDGAINTGANIFMAFSEESIVSSNGIPAVAR